MDIKMPELIKIGSEPDLAPIIFDLLDFQIDEDCEEDCHALEPRKIRINSNHLVMVNRKNRVI